jgi:hypothetical protein
MKEIMNLITLFSIAILAALAFVWLKRSSTEQKENEQAAQQYLKTMPIWVEVLGPHGEPWVVGRRRAWLPADEFGDGASMLVGAINLQDTDPALRAAIHQHCHPVYLDEHLVLAQIIVRPSSTEDLVMGPLDDPLMQEKLEAAIVRTNEIDVLAEVTSSAIGLMETEEDRRTFNDIRQQYVPA